MKQRTYRNLLVVYLVVFTSVINELQAQANCVLQAPTLRVDFGSTTSYIPVFSTTDDYQRVHDYCPQDGQYTIISSTINCFGGHWLSLPQDHTPGDTEGNMLVVNASYQAGVFFVSELKGLKPNSIYELGVSLMNICDPSYECTDIPPNLRFIIENKAGTELARFATGDIVPTGKVAWLQYAARFTAPADGSTLMLRVSNKANGGCGNDFAMDDIIVRECVFPRPVVKEMPKPKPVVKQPPSTTKPVVKNSPPAANPVKKLVPVLTQTGRDTVTTRQLIKERPVISLPVPISTRANPIIKQIETPAAEVVIDLYDNGEIDGDTVSIYHNNELIVSRAGLSAKPISFRLTVDDAHPHHELVMVANNLGSIPPNTSLMIVTAKNKRYEVFISSSEQKNAKVVIDLRSP